MSSLIINNIPQKWTMVYIETTIIVFFFILAADETIQNNKILCSQKKKLFYERSGLSFPIKCNGQVQIFTDDQKYF